MYKLFPEMQLLCVGHINTNYTHTHTHTHTPTRTHTQSNSHTQPPHHHHTRFKQFPHLRTHPTGKEIKQKEKKKETQKHVILQRR